MAFFLARDRFLPTKVHLIDENELQHAACANAKRMSLWPTEWQNQYVWRPFRTEEEGGHGVEENDGR